MNYEAKKLEKFAQTATARDYAAQINARFDGLQQFVVSVPAARIKAPAPAA